MNISINASIAIPEDELRYTYSRSSGPGGQHVNTTDTRVTLIFDVDNSPSLNTRQKKRLHQRLANRIGKDGTLKLSCGTERSRKRNQEIVLDRFITLLRQAFTVRKKRIATRPGKNAIARRITAKKQRGAIKKDRKKPSLND